MTVPLLEAPPSDVRRVVSPLAYVDGYDAVLDEDFAFVAYQETDRAGGAWRVQVRGLHTPGATLEPAEVQRLAREAEASGAPFALVGYRLAPGPGDLRQVELRLHQRSGRPAEVELFLRLRLASGAPDTPRSARFPWPASGRV